MERPPPARSRPRQTCFSGSLVALFAMTTKVTAYLPNKIAPTGKITSDFPKIVSSPGIKYYSAFAVGQQISGFNLRPIYRDNKERAIAIVTTCGGMRWTPMLQTDEPLAKDVRRNRSGPTPGGVLASSWQVGSESLKRRDDGGKESRSQGRNRL